MGTEPCIFQGKERKHGNKQIKERKKRSSVCAAWLKAVASPDYKGCSPQDACTVPACHSEASRDAGCSRTTACSTQACRLVADSSSATCVITDTGRNDPAEPWITRWGSPRAFAVGEVLGWLLVTKHQMHVLPPAASPEAEESTGTVSVFGNTSQSLETSTGAAQWWWAGAVQSRNTGTWGGCHGWHQAATLWALTAAQGVLNAEGPFPVTSRSFSASSFRIAGPEPQTLLHRGWRCEMKP